MSAECSQPSYGRSPWAYRSCPKYRARIADAPSRAARPGRPRSLARRAHATRDGGGRAWDVAAGAPIDDHVANAGTVQQRLVHGALERNLFTAPPAAIGCDHQGGVEILD